MDEGKVFAEIEEKGERIEIHFPYDPAWVVRIKGVPGSRFVPAEKGGPYWTVPLDLATARALRRAFGEALELGAQVASWGRRELAREQALDALGTASTAVLGRLPGLLPGLAQALKPYQRAGAAFIATAPHPLVADQPGLGKTLEAIAGIYEAGTEAGPNLVIAPLTSLETVWLYELERWIGHGVFVPQGTRAQREGVLKQFMEYAQGSGPAWLVVNPAMVRYRKMTDDEFAVWLEKETGEKSEKLEDGSYGWNQVLTEAAKSSKKVLLPEYPLIHEMVWNNIIMDEIHKAYRNPRALTAQGLFNLRVKENGKRIAMSGTPTGGKPINMWGILHWLRPDVFSSKWRWADQWLEVWDNGFGKEIGDVREGVRKEFDRHLVPYVLRRTKADVLKELPPKQHVEVWCDMTARQAVQYKRFARDAELGVKNGSIDGKNVLEEYLRLKQLAGSECEIRTQDNKVVPTGNSGKYAALFDRLDELGILEGVGDEQAVVFSQFSETVDMLYNLLKEKEVPVLKITGDVTKAGERARIQRSFQSGEARVMVMTTTAGGVAITLDRASHVHILDETWDPDNEEQAEDRCHRASRIHQVTVYRYRTRGTIEEFIRKVTLKKTNVAKQILDESRKGRLKLL